MKILATALLLSMVILYLFARYLKGISSFFEIVMAFTEAAMVGAFADWFAVVALFKHPLALPIPHTAIIPKNKDKLGEHLANFIRDNFLCQEALSAKLNSIDVTGTIGRVFSDDRKSKDLATKFVEYASVVLERLSDKDLRSFRKELTTRNIDQINLGPWLSKILETLTEDNSYQLLLDGVLDAAPNWLRGHKKTLRMKLKEGSPWWVPGVIDDKILEKILTGLEEAIMRIKSDPGHPMRRKLDDLVHQLINTLKDSRDFVGRVKDLKEKYFDHPSFREFFGQLSDGVKKNILKDLQNPDSTIRSQIETAFTTLGRGLEENPTVREKMNFWICSSLLRLSSEYADTISSIISDTVRKWDAERTSRTVELYIGKDLQWIRINGTLVGGLVGLLIYIVSRFLQ
jgi:uncharacterized membrane-anchored protein YjiN (DUF445 family)